MSKTLTDIAIRNLRPGATRREVPDPEARGLYLVVQPSGVKSFAVRYRHAGRTPSPVPESDRGRNGSGNFGYLVATGRAGGGLKFRSSSAITRVFWMPGIVRTHLCWNEP